MPPSNRYTQSQLDQMYAEFCARVGTVMDPGSDVHDHSSQP